MEVSVAVAVTGSMTDVLLLAADTPSMNNSLSVSDRNVPIKVCSLPNKTALSADGVADVTPPPLAIIW